MSSRARSGAARPPRGRTDARWSVLAGSAGAVALVGAYHASILAGLVATYVLLAALGAGCLYCVRPDVAPRIPTALRWVITGPLGVIAAFGLLSARGHPGSLLVVAVAMTSPPVVGRISRVLGRDRSGEGASRPPSGRAARHEIEPDVVDPRFDEMVPRLHDPGEPPRSEEASRDVAPRGSVRARRVPPPDHPRRARRTTGRSGQARLMHTTDERATYEIRLQGAPPGWLQEKYGAFRVSRAPTQTALFRRVASSSELDALLARLTSLGLTLVEVHEHKLPRPGEGTWVDPRQHPCGYEVRVDGRLGRTFLTFLRWRHCVVPEQTSVQVDATPEDVLQLVASCSDLGLGIERVRRVRDATEPQPRPPSPGDGD